MYICNVRLKIVCLLMNNETEMMDNVEVKTKRCSKCGRVLPITQFHKDKSSKDGLQCWCKQCHKAKQAEYYQANREYNVEWRAKHPTYDAERYDPQKNPLNWARKMVASYMQTDREKGFNDKETISVDYFINHIANEECKYCHKRGYGLIGCNRIDNTKPHTIDNVEPCCFKCNAKENILDQIRRGVHISCKRKARHKTA